MSDKPRFYVTSRSDNTGDFWEICERDTISDAPEGEGTVVVRVYDVSPWGLAFAQNIANFLNGKVRFVE